MREYGATEGSGHREGNQEGNQPFALTQEPAEQRKEKIEHLFDRKRPEDVPIAGKVAASCLQDVDVKSKRREKRPTQSTCFCRHNEVVNIREVQDAEDRQQQYEKRRNARESQPVESAQAHAP